MSHLMETYPTQGLAQNHYSANGKHACCYVYRKVFLPHHTHLSPNQSSEEEHKTGKKQMQLSLSCDPLKPLCGLGVRPSMTSASPLKLPAPKGRGCITAHTRPTPALQGELAPDLQQRVPAHPCKEESYSGKKGGLPRYLSICALFGSTTPSQDGGQGSSGYQVCSPTAAQTPRLCKVGERLLRSSLPNF